MPDFELAKEWLKPYAAKWQVLNRGEWKYAFHEKTLVRYLEEVNMDEDLAQSVLAYLKSDECVADLSLYDQKIAATWKPTRAWLEVSNKAVGNIKGVRLYHALIDASAKSGKGDGAYLIENGCAYKVSHTFFFNQPNPPTDADMAGKYKSTSGVSYQVGSLGVNPDTGLWNYVIEKRERVQQDVTRYTTAKTAFEEHEEEVHLGVKQDKISTTGKAAGVSGGTITHRKITKNGDCTSDVHNTYETEKEVKEASVTVSVTRTGSTIETSNRSVSSPLATTNLKVGESVTNTKTPAGKWNTVYRKHVKNALNWIAEACSKTIFSHSHSKTTNQAEDPGFKHTEEAANGVIIKKSVRAEDDGSFTITEDKEEEQTVNNASVSKRVTLGGTEVREEHRNLKEEPSAADLTVGESLTVSKTNGGLWNAVKTKFVAKAIDKIRESCSQNLFSHTHSSTKIVTEDPGFSHAEFTANGVVTRIEVTKNENGTWTMTTSTEEEKKVDKAEVSAQKNLFEKQTSETHRGQDEAPSAADLENGERLTVRKTASGKFDVVKSKSEELNVPKASVSVQKTLHGEIRREEARGQDEPLNEAGLKLGELVTNTKTANGKYNTSKTTPSVTGGGKIAVAKNVDYFSSSVQTVENKKLTTPVSSATLSGGVLKEVSSRLDGDGTADVTTHTITPKAWKNEYDFTQLRDQTILDGADTSVKVKVITYGNQAKIPSYVQLKNQTVSVSDHLNRFGLHDGEIRITTDNRLRLKSSNANSGIYTFTKHGKVSTELEWADNVFDQPYVRKWSVKPVHRCASYMDYINDLGNEVVEGQEGISNVKLIHEMRDSLGNRYAEWTYEDRCISQAFTKTSSSSILRHKGRIKYVGRLNIKGGI